MRNERIKAKFEKLKRIMVDNARYMINEWFQVTENVKDWEDQIRKLKEDLSELADSEIESDIVKSVKLEEDVLKLK
jgi:hypothetical protein